jgi:hypothetical protein
MSIQYAVPIPEKSHVLHVGLLVPNSVEKVDPVTGVVTMVDGIQEIPVRKSHYESLSATEKLTYVTQCAEFHHPADRARAQARRDAWDADDKAKAEAKFIMRHVSTEGDTVTVSVTWQGLTAQHTILNDPATATANAQAAHQAVLDAKAAEAEATAAFNVG